MESSLGVSSVHPVSTEDWTSWYERQSGGQEGVEREERRRMWFWGWVGGDLVLVSEWTGECESIGKGGWNYIQWDPWVIHTVDWIETCLINKLSPVILAIHVVGLRFYINSKNQLLKIYKLMIITDDITAIWLRCVIFQEDIQDKRWRHKCSRLFPLLLFKTLWLITYIFFNWNYLYIHFIRFHGKPNYLILLIMQNEKGVLYL